jgi:hypothetical protein
MSEMSFGAGAEARGRVGNVFLAFAEVKRVISECQLSRKSYTRTITRKRIQSTRGIVSLRFPSLLFPFADLACPT